MFARICGPDCVGTQFLRLISFAQLALGVASQDATDVCRHRLAARHGRLTDLGVLVVWDSEVPLRRLAGRRTTPRAFFGHHAGNLRPDTYSVNPFGVHSFMYGQLIIGAIDCMRWLTNKKPVAALTAAGDRHSGVAARMPA